MRIFALNTRAGFANDSEVPGNSRVLQSRLKEISNLAQKSIGYRYKGRSAENINYVRCEIANSGTAVVRKQQLRYEFPASMEILTRVWTHSHRRNLVSLTQRGTPTRQ